jgi:hypothetical protein
MINLKLKQLNLDLINSLGIEGLSIYPNESSVKVAFLVV